MTLRLVSMKLPDGTTEAAKRALPGGDLTRVRTVPAANRPTKVDTPLASARSRTLLPRLLESLPTLAARNLRLLITALAHAKKQSGFSS